MSGPLSTLKILDFTTLLPGPYATQILADMDADILRIEAPGRADLVREMPPLIDTENGSVSAAHATLNRNKKSIGINLKSEQASAIIKKLLSRYDIIIEQFRPGVMKKFGLDYETLSKEKPELIYCSITGYGQYGPLHRRAGHDINYLSLSGLASISGRSDTGPILSGTQIADIAGGSHHAVMAILAAVIQRQATGLGQFLDISMSDAALALSTFSSANHLADGSVPGLGTELLNGGIFYEYYETRDKRYFSVGSLEPAFFQQLLTAINKPQWLSRAMTADPEKQKALADDIADIFRTETFEYWQALFEQYDACVEPVLTLEEACQHPHFIERKMFVDVPVGLAPSSELNPVSDTQPGKPCLSVKQVASPMKFSGFTPQYRHTGPALGADTVSVLKQCGFDEAAIEEFKRNNVVA